LRRNRTFDTTFFYPTFVLRLKLKAMKATLLFLSGVGFQEILLIGVFVLVFFGAKKIPEFMKGLGKGVREFKDAVKDVKKEVEESGSAGKIEEGK
jgi:sec-independent protein translocase protein TatA